MDSEHEVFESRYRLLIGAITDYAIYMLDPQGNVTSWNPGAQRFKGYTESEIIGHHFSRFYSPEDRAAGLPERALKVAALEGRFENEGWRMRKDGTRFWANVVIDPIRSASGELLGFSKITRDFTERKATEDALRQSEQQFRLLIQSVKDYAIYMLDPDGRVTNWNAGAQKIKGYAPQEIIGEHFSRFYSEEDRAAGIPQRNLTIAAREGRFEKEGWRLRKDGTRFWANVIIDAIRNDDGELIGYAKVTRDITERRDAQNALEKTREALMQSQKMEAVGQLTGGVAHDFNNLLMAILSSLELMKTRLPENSSVLPLLDNANQAAQRGATLTQRMLAFARRQEMKPVAVEIPVLVNGMADLLQRTLGPTIKIITQFPLGLGQVFADPNQLEMALLNLVVNARDAMPDGGSIVIGAKEFEISKATEKLSAGRYVCLSVKDTGEGMDERTVQRAMEPFFTTKGIGKGTGLGLSMVHGMAEQLGGALRLESEFGKGTTAEICLPLIEKPVAEVAPPAQTEPAEAGRRLKVLAVDDDSLVLLNTVLMLEDLGHEVCEATSGVQALKILNADSQFDLVLSDQAMPNMTGLQLAGEIKMRWPSIQVIIATGYAELPLGVPVEKLSKPFLMDDLARAIAGIAKSTGKTI